MKRMAVVLLVLLLCGCSGISDSFPTRPEATRPPLPESAYAPTDFQWEEGFLNCLAGNAVLGIDVSSHQQEIDWQAVAASGVKFAIIRLGYRGLKEGQLYEDSYARQNLQGARDAGLLVGAYFFSQAVSTDEALEEAQLALQEGEMPVGCVIACGEKIIARGHNLREQTNDPTAHAEMIAITAATEAMGGKYLNDCTLYLTVEPCPMCAGALAWAQIGKVVYGASDLKRGFSLFSPSLLHPKTEVVSGILAEECGNLVSDFFRKKRS